MHNQSHHTRPNAPKRPASVVFFGPGGCALRGPARTLRPPRMAAPTRPISMAQARPHHARTSTRTSFCISTSTGTGTTHPHRIPPARPRP